MTSHLKKVLIVGGESAIGAALGQYLEARGVEIVATTRREDPAGGQISLDLAAPDAWPDLPDVDGAVIAAAVTALDACHADPQSSRVVNVEGAAEAARRLAGQGAFVLHLSTNQVFDGGIAYRKETDQPAPVSQYGRQKFESETRILELGDQSSVLRLTKVLTGGLPVIERWRALWADGAEAEAFDDMTLAPLPVRVVCELAARILDARASGIFHASGDTDLSYYDLARQLAARMGVDADQVKATSVADAPVLPEAAPVHTTLDMGRAIDAFGITPPSSWAAVEAVLGNGSDSAYRNSTPDSPQAAPQRAAVA